MGLGLGKGTRGSTTSHRLWATCHPTRLLVTEILVLVLYRCQSVQAAITDTIDWVAYKQQKFISHCPGGWEVQGQGTSRFGVR